MFLLCFFIQNPVSRPDTSFADVERGGGLVLGDARHHRARTLVRARVDRLLRPHLLDLLLEVIQDPGRHRLGVKDDEEHEEEKEEAGKDLSNVAHGCGSFHGNRSMKF